MKTLGLLLLCCWTAQGYDFSMGLSGPSTATPGYPVYLHINQTITDGARSGWHTYEVPGTFTASLVGPGTQPIFGNKTTGVENVTLRLDIPLETQPGVYAVIVRAESQGVVHSAEMMIEVVSPVSYFRIMGDGGGPAVVKLWERNMVVDGGERCNEEDIRAAGTWEGNIWYYDGIRVFHQIADYLGDAKWTACAAYVKRVYLPYVLANEGRIPGYRVFAQGLYEDFLRTGDEASKTAVLLLAKNSAYAGYGGGVSPNRSRETAFALNSYRWARNLGEPSPLEERALAFALGHIDQWYNLRAVYTGGDYYVQPFMVGLTLEALIHYYEEIPDPRIPAAVQMAVDGLWEQWVPKDQAFDYITNDDQVEGAPDLNLLIAPAFAWLYLQTGNDLYRARGEQVFTGGVRRAWLGRGKQFSQNYRWSFDYVSWTSIAGGQNRRRSNSRRSPAPSNAPRPYRPEPPP